MKVGTSYNDSTMTFWTSKDKNEPTKKLIINGNGVVLVDTPTEKLDVSRNATKVTI